VRRASKKILSWSAAGSFLTFHAAFLTVVATSAEPSVPPELPARHRFNHPGVLNSLSDLEFVRDRIRAGAQPWLGAYDRLKREPVAQAGFQPRACEVVFTNVLAPDFDRTTTTAQNLSAHAAYAHALRWFIDDDPIHAEAARRILRSWSVTLRRHEGSPNAALQAAWVVPVFVRAAEILRSSDRHWSPDDQAGFARLIRDVFLPLVMNGAPTTAGNWELSFVEAILSIAVFTEDRALFHRGLTLLHYRLKNYFYVAADGPHPVMPVPLQGREYPKWSEDLFVRYQTEAGRREYWYLTSRDRFHPGQCQETGRDLLHVQMEIAAAANSLEIARTQGLDLFVAYGPRIAAGLEFNAAFLLGGQVPSDLHGGTLKWTDKREPAWEIATLRLRQSAGLQLPLSSRIVAEHRDSPPPAKLHMAWETLTHADLPPRP